MDNGHPHFADFLKSVQFYMLSLLEDIYVNDNDVFLLPWEKFPSRESVETYSEYLISLYLNKEDLYISRDGSTPVSLGSLRGVEYLMSPIDTFLVHKKDVDIRKFSVDTFELDIPRLKQAFKDLSKLPSVSPLSLNKLVVRERFATSSYEIDAVETESVQSKRECSRYIENFVVAALEFLITTAEVSQEGKTPSNNTKKYCTMVHRLHRIYSEKNYFPPYGISVSAYDTMSAEFQFIKDFLISFF